MTPIEAVFSRFERFRPICERVRNAFRDCLRVLYDETQYLNGSKSFLFEKRNGQRQKVRAKGAENALLLLNIKIKLVIIRV